VFVRRELFGRYPVLFQEFEPAAGTPLPLVHPRLHAQMEQRLLGADEGRRAIATEVEKHRAEAEAQRARADSFGVESERHRAAAEAYKLAAEPRNMSLKQLLHALPRVALGALKRRIRRYSGRG
jgi:hypothetical protein